MTALLVILRRIPAEVWIGLLLLGALGGGLYLVYAKGYRAAVADMQQQLDESNARADALRARVAELESANAAARQVIGQLAKVNRELAEGREADQQAAAEAVADLRSERDALQKELDRRRNDRGVLYERDESAAAWARARVPDAVADSLRR